MTDFQSMTMHDLKHSLQRDADKRPTSFRALQQSVKRQMILILKAPCAQTHCTSTSGQYHNVRYTMSMTSDALQMSILKSLMYKASRLLSQE